MSARLKRILEQSLSSKDDCFIYIVKELEALVRDVSGLFSGNVQQNVNIILTGKRYVL